MSCLTANKSKCESCGIAYLSFNNVPVEVCPACGRPLMSQGSVNFYDQDKGIYPVRMNPQTAAESYKRVLKRGLAPKEVISKIAPERMRLVYYPIRKTVYSYNAEVTVKTKFKKKKYNELTQKNYFVEREEEYPLPSDGFLVLREVANSQFNRSGLEYEFSKESKDLFEDSLRENKKKHTPLEEKERMMSFPDDPSNLPPVVDVNVDSSAYPNKLFRQNCLDRLGDQIMDYYKDCYADYGHETGSRLVILDRLITHVKREYIQYVPVWVSSYDYKGHVYWFGYDELFNRAVGLKNPVSGGKVVARVLTIVGVILALFIGFLIYQLIKRLNIPTHNDYSNWTPPENPVPGAHYMPAPAGIILMSLKLMINHLSIILL